MRDVEATQNPLRACSSGRGDGRWKMGAEIYSMYSGSKGGNIFLLKCLRECFSLADGLRTSMKILECSGTLIVIWTPEFSFYYKGSHRKHSTF